MPTNKSIEVSLAESLSPHATETQPGHHVGNPPTSFQNPWPSSVKATTGQLFSARFLRTEDRNFVPVPANREGLVAIRKPDWAASNRSNLRATWLGHASFLVETQASNAERGVRILLDPVFSERTSPVQWFGPKRYSPTPCQLSDLPDIDVIAISHNHYDHLDTWTIKECWRLGRERGHTPVIACALQNSSYFLGLGIGIAENDIVELDWWHAARIDVQNAGTIELVCTPAQHGSTRSAFDKDRSLWCSWTIRELDIESPRSLFFAGDTGYRHVNSAHPTKEEEENMPHCPAFKDIGDTYGPFDLALLPIGLCTPRDLVSTVHCSPHDTVCLHKDLRSKKSIGMHYGTVRGGISAYYEDVRDPPALWEKLCTEKDLKWGEETGLCDIGETILA